MFATGLLDDIAMSKISVKLSIFVHQNAELQVFLISDDTNTLM